MNFSAKEDYGIRAIVDIAMQRESAPIQAKDIASRQDISEQYLEQVMANLRRAGIVRSTRGAGGGYDLARPADQITVGSILRALSGPLIPMQCLEDDKGQENKSCNKQELHSVHNFWKRLRDAMSQVVDTTSIQDLVDSQLELQANQSFMMNI